MIVVVAGSVTDKETVYSAIDLSGFRFDILLSGNTEVDQIAEEYAREKNIRIVKYAPGNITFMAEQADALIAVWDGTIPLSIIDEFERLKKPTFVAQATH